MTKVDRYLVIVVGDIEPELHKFETDEQRDNAAIEHKREEGDDDGIFKLDIVDGVPVMMTYSRIPWPFLSRSRV